MPRHGHGAATASATPRGPGRTRSWPRSSRPPATGARAPAWRVGRSASSPAAVPDLGRAAVLVDGEAVGLVDLYAPDGRRARRSSTSSTSSPGVPATITLSRPGPATPTARAPRRRRRLRDARLGRLTADLRSPIVAGRCSALLARRPGGAASPLTQCGLDWRAHDGPAWRRKTIHMPMMPAMATPKKTTPASRRPPTDDPPLMVSMTEAA